jgi:hypothetical protein
MSFILPNLAIAGYRSFGRAPQYLDRLAKINIFIGQNNAGKSNVLRFLQEVCARADKVSSKELDPLSYHLPDRPPLLCGVGEPRAQDESSMLTMPIARRLVSAGASKEVKLAMARLLSKVTEEKASRDNTNLCWTYYSPPERAAKHDDWVEALEVLTDQEVHQLWHHQNQSVSGGDRKQHWEPQLVHRLPAPLPSISVQLVPANRQIGGLGSTSDSFDGEGIIERLVKLQNPGVHDQGDRDRFKAITDFAREVLSRPEAQIEVPHQKDTILVHMDGKVLPIESLGSGVHEVLILATAATVLANHVVCIEEPEIHLNPILQRKLMRYLARETSNQYFITTHSAALMDTPDAEIYHVTLVDGSSTVVRATLDRQRSSVCEDLGYHPSDLLQANCVIWVEGPSDRIYFNWWLRAIDPTLIEGIHYSVMFYGGKLAAHLSNADDTADTASFISLRRLNRRSVIVIDSDRDKPRAHINQTKQRLQKEFDLGPGHAWITAGREIENYLAPSQIGAALQSVCPKSAAVGSTERYDNLLRVKTVRGKESQAPKVDIARYIAATFEPDFSAYDLRERLIALKRFILESNPPQVPG